MLARRLRALVALAALIALGVPASASATGSQTPPPGVDLTNADRCDFLDPAQCLLPWPNDYFTVPDRHTDTGRRINFSPAAMPVNKNGELIDPAEYNRSDGFSPGNLIITKVPGLDTPAAFAKHRRRPDHGHCADLRPQAAGRRDQHAHAEAPPRSGPSSTRTPPTRRT